VEIAVEPVVDHMLIRVADDDVRVCVVGYTVKSGIYGGCKSPPAYLLPFKECHVNYIMILIPENSKCILRRKGSTFFPYYFELIDALIVPSAAD
jgi:hypothetical protein